MGDLVIIFIFFNTFVRYLLVFKWVSKFPQNSREVWAIWEECVRYSGGLNKLRCAEKIRFGKRLNGNIRQRCTCLHNRTIAQCVIAHLHNCTIEHLQNCTMQNCTMHMYHSPPNATSLCSSLHYIFNWTSFSPFCHQPQCCSLYQSVQIGFWENFNTL